MDNLLNFLSKYKTAFLFLFLQFIAFILIVQNNQYHKAGFLNATNFITGSIHSTFKSINIYFGLKAENEKLALENAQLRNQLKHVEYTLIPPYKIDSSFVDSTENIFTLDTLVLDSTKKTKYIPALAISNSTNKRLNYIYLNKGKQDGIEKDMGVLESHGVVGVIVNASKHYSLVMPITNIRSSLSVKIKNQDYFGTLKWNEVNYQYAHIIEVPNHVELSLGDTIITSGYSQIFPQGEMIGFVESSNKVAGSSFLDLKIKLAVNFAKLNHCYVVGTTSRQEIESLNIE